MPKTKIKAKLRVEKDPDFLLQAPEVSIFLACREAVNDLRGLANAFESGEVTKSVFSQESSALVDTLNDIVAATERFDIVWPVMAFGRFSPFFWRWFNWWDDYLKELTPRQVSQLERTVRQSTHEVHEHRPKEHWVQYRHAPAFAIVIT